MDRIINTCTGPSKTRAKSPRCNNFSASASQVNAAIKPQGVSDTCQAAKGSDARITSSRLERSSSPPGITYSSSLTSSRYQGKVGKLLF